MRAFDGGKVFLSTTFGANPVGLAAAKATIQALQKPDTYTVFIRRGAEVVETIAGMLMRYQLPISIRGNHARFVFDFAAVDGIASAEELRTLWMQEMCKEFILAGVPYFPMVCWDAQVLRQIFAGAERACHAIQRVIHGHINMTESLEVPVITDVFSGRYAKSEEDARD